MNLILKAARIAERAHRNQKRKWNQDPYILHPARVAGRVGLHHLATETMMAAAYLHDVLEDTGMTAMDLEREVGPPVTDLVVALTNPSKRTQAPRGIRKEIDRQHLSLQSQEVKIIKMLDRIDNLREAGPAPSDFRRLYGNESLLLAFAIGDADDILRDELVRWAELLKLNLDDERRPDGNRNP